MRSTLRANALILADQLEALLRVADAHLSTVNVYAHSMGANLLAEALHVLAARGSMVRERLGQVILAHPDILWRDFRKPLSDVVHPTTLMYGELLAMAGGKRPAPLSVAGLAARIPGRRVACTVYYHPHDSALGARSLLYEGGTGDSVGWGPHHVDLTLLPHFISFRQDGRPLRWAFTRRSVRSFAGFVPAGMEFVTVYPPGGAFSSCWMLPKRHSDSFSKPQNLRDLGVLLYTAGLCGHVRARIGTVKIVDHLNAHIMDVAARDEDLEDYTELQVARGAAVHALQELLKRLL